MPSGLTHKIYSGEDTSLRNFALTCVKQLGAGYRATDGGEKDLPMDKAPVLEVSDYHLKQLEAAKKRLKKWLDLKNNPEELTRLYNEAMASRVKDNIKIDSKVGEIRDRYNSMKERVLAWDIPEEYGSLKKLMLEQLDSSLEWDCRERAYANEEPNETEEEWYQVNLEANEWDVNYHTEQYEKEKANVEENNRYLRGLYDAIDKVEPLNSK